MCWGRAFSDYIIVERGCKSVNAVILSLVTHCQVKHLFRCCLILVTSCSPTTNDNNSMYNPVHLTIVHSTSTSTLDSLTFYFFFIHQIAATHIAILQIYQSKMSPTVAAASRTRALSLYRKLLKSATKMPTPNRQNYIVKKTREEYRANKSISDPEQIEFLIRLADTNLDTVLVQADHLTNLFHENSKNTDL